MSIPWCSISFIFNCCCDRNFNSKWFNALSNFNPFDTDVDVSGQEGNYATLNPLSGGTDVQYKENNLYIEAGTDHGRFGQSPSTLIYDERKILL